jgi:HAD superfamily hydrolase (TIGR01509 family)
MHNRQILPLWLGEDLPAGEVERLSLRKEELYRQVAAKSLRPLDGVVDLITSLADDGFLLAVGSSGPSANVELVLNSLGVRERFTALSTGDDVQHGKPDPQVFLNAAKKLRLPPASCAVIEDAPQGVVAGLRAGARVVAVSSTRPREELTGAHLVVGSLTELCPSRLRELIQGGK